MMHRVQNAMPMTQYSRWGELITFFSVEIEMHKWNENGKAQRNIRLVPCYLLDDALKSPIGLGNKSFGLSVYFERTIYEMKEKNKKHRKIKWKTVHKLSNWFFGSLVFEFVYY